MAITVGILVGEGFIPLVPIWFYLFSSIAYGAAAVISLLVAYFSFKIFWSNRKMKTNLLLSLGFAGLAFAFAALTFTSLYTYLYDPYLKGFLSLSLVNIKGFNLYYIISLISYVALNIVYLPKKIMKKLKIAPLLFVSLWYINSDVFNIVSIFLLAIVSLKAVRNFLKSKSLNSFLVMFCFLAMIAFHGMIYVLPFDITFYLLAHLVLAVGFTSLLIMLIRVNGSARKKK
jgi:hypothetical protein